MIQCRMSGISVDFFKFLSIDFDACLKPPSRDNHRKESYPRTQQHDQGAGEPRSCNQGRPKNNAFTLSAMLPTWQAVES